MKVRQRYAKILLVLQIYTVIIANINYIFYL